MFIGTHSNVPLTYNVTLLSLALGSMWGPPINDSLYGGRVGPPLVKGSRRRGKKYVARSDQHIIDDPYGRPLLCRITKPYNQTQANGNWCKPKCHWL